jgi:RNA polymerase sigma factor (sigma-70 family)
MVDETLRDDLRTLWQHLSQRNDWMLVQDEATFLDDVVTAFTALTGNASPRERLRLAVWRTYSVLLYKGLQQRQERAAQELWIAFVRWAYTRGLADADAHELAQEAVLRVIERLPTLRTPAGLLSWAMKIFRTVHREYRQQTQHTLSLHAVLMDQPQHEPTDPSDLVMDTEQRLVSRHLVQMLQTTLPNPLERLVLLRIVLFADKPRDVARDLAIPLHRTRVAKHRALARLRDAPQVMETLNELAGAISRPTVTTGDIPDGR